MSDNVMLRSAPPKNLRQAHLELKQQNPGIRARDAAAQLGISEAELVASRIGEGVTRLTQDFAAILKAMPQAGTIMALTRNEHCVHERHGAYGNVSIGPGHAIVLNHEIDLRLFMSHWRYGFAVTEEVRSGLRTSLQFFDIDGTAIHKIYATDRTDRAAFDDIITRFTCPDQDSRLEITPLPERPAQRPDSEIDAERFRNHWRALQDVHDFFGMLQEFGVQRHQAMRLAAGEFTSQVHSSSARTILEKSAETGLSIMCFTGNPGCIQIHTGPVKDIKVMGPWCNVLDPDFNLHLREDHIHEAWVVRKPTRDGIITSLELFNKDGFCFTQFFGARKPGEKELVEWRNIIASLDQTNSAETCNA